MYLRATETGFPSLFQQLSVWINTLVETPPTCRIKRLSVGFLMPLIRVALGWKHPERTKARSEAWRSSYLTPGLFLAIAATF